ncbi:MAG: helix-turn-helix transcriptional regulator [Planctomycetes bacterium]|nr:helix-turn-helix transcriptional regulator [Planctomycetota bacterium]
MAAIDHVDVLFRSETVRLADYVCRGSASPWSAEESSGGNAIVFPRAGLHVKRVGKVDAVADANHVIFYNEGEVYRVLHPADGGDDCTEIGLSRHALIDLLGERAADRRMPFTLTQGPSTSRSYATQLALLEFARTHRDAEGLAIEERALALAADVLADANRWAGRREPKRRASTARVHREIADAVKMLVGARFRERLALADVARTVHASPFHLSRVFARETGIPIHRYQRRLRLRAALERLDGGNSNLTRLALDLGFASHAHFTEAFGREFGVPPSNIQANRRSWRDDSRRRWPAARPRSV